MKTRDKKSLHEKTLPELKILLTEIKKALHEALMEKAQNKLKNTRLIFLKRKEIAQVKTILNEKSMLPSKGDAKK